MPELLHPIFEKKIKGLEAHFCSGHYSLSLSIGDWVGTPPGASQPREYKSMDKGNFPCAGLGCP